MPRKQAQNRTQQAHSNPRQGGRREHSNAHKLEVSKSNANQWIKAMELTRRRLLNPEAPTDIFGTYLEQLEVDLHFFLAALMRFYRSLDMAATLLPKTDSLTEKIKDFHKYIGIKRTMRNVGEHFDEYLDGRGRDQAVDSAGLQVWHMTCSETNIRFWWLGETFDLKRTMDESEALWTEFLGVYYDAVSS